MTGPDPATERPKRRPDWADLGPRLISAGVLIAVTATALVLGGFFFSALVAAAFGGMTREWETMVTRAPLRPVSWVVVGLVAGAAFVFPLFGAPGTLGLIAIACVVALAGGREELSWRLGGIVFVGAVILALLALRGTGEAGIWAGLYLGTVVWMTDSAAFFAGRQIGGEKLAPDISPSKTWSGALGGLALGAVSGTVLWAFVTDSPLWIGAALSIAVSVLAQLGDLSESAVKRRFRIKDSGDIIPGHGGLMDRLDSLTLAVIFVALVGLAFGGPEDVAGGLLAW